MIPSEFEYFVASSLDEAVSLLQRYGDEAKVMAGGHSLIPLMKLRLAQPKYIIDIGRLPGLSYIREEDGAIAVGALTTHHMLETSDLLKAKLPLLAETAAVIADVQVRNRGTIGGSLAHADPASDLPATVLALGGELTAVGPGGQRRIRAEDFFVGMLTTALQPAEILTQVRLPLPPPRSGGAYRKHFNPASHFAVVGVAALITLGGDGVCQQARIGLTGVAAKPQRATGAEAALVGKALDEAAISEAAEKASDGLQPVSDVHASGEFRLHLARVYTKRALQLALSRVEG